MFLVNFRVQVGSGEIIFSTRESGFVKSSAVVAEEVRRISLPCSVFATRYWLFEIVSRGYRGSLDGFPSVLGFRVSGRQRTHSANRPVATIVCLWVVSICVVKIVVFSQSAYKWCHASTLKRRNFATKNLLLMKKRFPVASVVCKMTSFLQRQLCVLRSLWPRVSFSTIGGFDAVSCDEFNSFPPVFWEGGTQPLGHLG